jgi:hypothetical protein
MLRNGVRTVREVAHAVAVAPLIDGIGVRGSVDAQKNHDAAEKDG